MPPIFFQLPKGEPSPAELVPDRYEAREVRLGLWRSYPWKRELGATLYSVACSGAVHAALIAVVLLTAVNLAPEKIEPVETLDSSLIKVKFVFHKKEQPVEKEVVKAPKKAPAIKPLVEKSKPEAVAKKTPPPKKTRPRVRPKKKQVAKKSAPKTRQLAAGVSEEGTAPLRKDPPKVTKVDPDLQLDTATEPPKVDEEVVNAPVVAEQAVTPVKDSVDLNALYAAYRAQVHGSFKRHSRYPRRAERAGLEGKVVVQVVIDGKGMVVARRILRSSGHSILDKAALKAAQKISQLPAPPSELKWSKKTLEVPFVYRTQTNASVERWSPSKRVSG